CAHTPLPAGSRPPVPTLEPVRWIALRCAPRHTQLPGLVEASVVIPCEWSLPTTAPRPRGSLSGTKRHGLHCAAHTHRFLQGQPASLPPCLGVLPGRAEERWAWRKGQPGTPKVRFAGGCSHQVGTSLFGIGEKQTFEVFRGQEEPGKDKSRPGRKNVIPCQRG